MDKSVLKFYVQNYFKVASSHAKINENIANYLLKSKTENEVCIV